MRSLVLVFLFSVSPLILFAQLPEQKKETDPATDAAVSVYASTVRYQSMLFNGEDYLEIPEPYQGYPFFGSAYWEEGTVDYYGQHFEQVTMRYDLVRDYLVIEHYDQDGYAVSVRLHPDKVERFSLLGHTFVRVDTAATDLKPGFYDLLHRGKTDVLCKRRKMTQERVTAGAIDRSFLEKTAYYLRYDGVAYPIRNKKSVTRVFPDHKKALNQYAKSRNFDFHLNRASNLVELVAYAETLLENAPATHEKTLKE